MAAILLATANDTLNRVAAETGLDTDPDPFASSEKVFIQMRYLLNVAGEELIQNYAWETLVKSHEIVTDGSEEYDLPDDFLYMLNQTGWERTQTIPMVGPLSPQDWTCLLGRDLTGGSLYASFRINDGVLKLMPLPVPSDLEISFEYMSRNWVLDSTTGTTYIDACQVGSDTPQLDRTLLSRYLKVKFLEAKGLDSTKAQADLNHIFGLLTARDKGAAILNTGSGWRGYPYLNGTTSVPDSGYG